MFKMVFLAAFLIIFLSMSFARTTEGQEDVSTVYLSLKGAYLGNNSFVDVDDIGEDENALICHTDKTDCCRDNREGEWYFPNGTVVQTYNGNIYHLLSTAFFYRSRGETSVLLNRNQSPSERGHFYCKLSDANAINRTLSVNILEIGSITMKPKGNHIHVAGEFVNIRCSIDIAHNPLPLNVPPPTFEWFFGPDNASLPSGVTVSPVISSGNTYTSILQFSPLRYFHAGSYSCRFGNNERLVSTSSIITVSIISGSGTTPIPGQSFTLICNISGIEYLDSHTASTITYQWTRNNGTRTQLMTTSNTLHFGNLRLYDAGSYRCDVTINSQVFTYTEYLDITIPEPVSVLITSNQVSPVRPIGANVTLTCTVEVSPVVDVPVTVNTEWTGPDGFMTANTAQIVVGATTTLASTTIVSSFGRNQSGSYFCTATITSLSPFLIDSVPHSSRSNITVGVYLSLRGGHRANNSVILMTEIGETNNSIGAEKSQNNGLQCISDRMPCCRFSYRVGEWFYPNGTLVSGRTKFYYDTTYHEYYRNRGHDDGTVTLNCPNTTFSPTGKFCCILPNALDVFQTLCVHIVSVVITRLGSTIAGEYFAMDCSVNGFDATLEWFDGFGNKVTSGGSITVTLSSSVVHLRFSPLHQSHGGNYTCKASISGITDSKFAVFTVKAPAISADISNSSAPISESSYSLLCTISGAEYLQPTIVYRWMKNNGTLTQVGTNSNTLTLPSLRLSDRGHYSCMATITSDYLLTSINVSSRSLELRLSIPQPMVCLVSNKANPIISGTCFSLTCSVEFSSVVDVPLSISTILVRPDTSNSDILPVANSLTHYTSLALINSTELADSGEYTCTVNIDNVINTSVTKVVIVVDGMFQLKLTRMKDCQKWTEDQVAKYTHIIEEALVEAVKSRCKCYFSRDNLLKEVYCCDKSPNFVTYRNTIIGTHNFNSTQIIRFIQDWVNSGPKIKFDWFAVRVDSSCSTAIESLEDPECGQ